VNVLPWSALIVLLVVVFMLAVAFAAGMVVLLVWLKRRRIKDAGKEPDFASFDDIGLS
jgi:hypothetical protein